MTYDAPVYESDYRGPVSPRELGPSSDQLPVYATNKTSADLLDTQRTYRTGRLHIAKGHYAERR